MTTAVEHRPLRARLAVATVFFINGAALASWVPHIPTVKAQHGLDDGQLGLVLLSMAVGAVLALPLAGWLVDRAGSRRVTSLCAIGLCVALPLPLLSPNLPALSGALAIFGACNATLDVAMNAQAVIVERRYRRAIMSSFHGLFSLGGLVGAAIAGGVMALGAPSSPQVLGTALVLMLSVFCCLRWLPPSSPRAAHPAPVFAVPRGVLVGLGVLALCGLLAEGAMGDWTAVYLRDTLGSSAAIAAHGFAAFSLAMALGRFGGDRLVARFGPDAVLRVSTSIAALGLTAALLLGDATAGIAGFGLVGLGISNVIPIVFSAAGRAPGVDAGTALAAVATTGYCGFLAGPPAIGLVADAVGLRAALGIVSALCALIAMGAGIVRTGSSGASMRPSDPRAAA